ncbi:MAG: PhnD/SsuA/transferrin family substrate-binding protein [Campylobacterales bacterium]|nr:PhnD/SsuA/transferrin family substrate-binding protein [Campylobacterales bacterium]
MRAWLILFILFNSALASGAEFERPITFAPLPMKSKERSIEAFLPLIDHLREHLDVTVIIHYKSPYGEILEGFEAQQIDLAYLGPLPLSLLKKRYPHVVPIIAFNQHNGSSRYRCVLSKFKKDRLPTDRPLKVALTQPLSTCGYYMTQRLLQEHYGIALETEHFDYLMSHTNALIETLKGNFDIAGATEEIAEQFHSLGMETVAYSDALPGFVLVANTQTLSPVQIEALKQSILSIKPEQYTTWGETLHHGFSKADPHEYDAIELDVQIPMKGRMP